MNLSGLVSRVHARHPELSRRELEASMARINRSIIAALTARGRVEIRGFGSFHLSRQRPRKVYHMRTGASLYVPTRWIPRFKPGKRLRERVDAGAHRA